MNLLINLKSYFEKINYLESSIKGEKVKLKLATLDFPSNEKIRSHYTLKEQGHTIHATSNSNFSLQSFQRIGVAMPAGIKSGAAKPSTIISANFSKIREFNKFIEIPRYQIDAFYSTQKDLFELPPKKEEYFFERRAELLEIFEKNLSIPPKFDNLVYDELITGNYAIFLVNSSNTDFLNLIQSKIDE